MNTILPTFQLEPSPQSWQQALQDLIKKPSELAELLNLSPEKLSQEAAEQFEVRVTRHFASLMEPGNPNDPLLLQVLPGIAETIDAEGYSSEPLMESDQFNPRPGVIHKYKGRLLLMASNQCAINCRYCFRRHFPYQDHHLGRKQWLEAVDYIAQDHSLSEVILSGGDPLSQSDKQLSWLAEQLQDIPHIKRLRIHSRLPVVLPSRVDEKLLSWIKSEQLQTSMVLHINHPQEMSTELTHACKRLKDADVRLFNQSVLLKGINDNSGILAELSKALFESHIQPYYLHQLDKVQGAAHFQVEDEDASRLYYELRAELPGYLVPLLTQEVPGKTAKTPIV